MNERKVIVAEDDEEMLDAVASALEQEGARVVRVQSGAGLIQSLAEESFDLIVTDVSMPWMSGLQVALSARNAHISTPLIVMTGSHRKEIDAQVRALGERTLLLRKPFDLEELRAAVRSLCPS